MPLLHHLARTGGTLISRCLASMEDVCLLSEIHPEGAEHFNPLRQAADWYGFVSDEEARSFDPNDSESVRSAVHLIHQRAHQNSRSLIVRDWSHLDWIGFPFVASPPMRFTWDDPKIERPPIGEPVEWWIHNIFEKVVTASSSMVRLKFKKHSKCEHRDSNLSNNHSLFVIVRN
ncbi:hypothetical protein [Rhodopirellula sp. SWK7]|uniref:hypothetical protein n=1 Tax=Rhodopirellula sp. SWK7 TaxID=595460 RepID=UPI0002C037E0|nr:hypothetical protein [Rhodopirellula sp. SWK7]EMI40333.1 TPR repeat-containing protein [Rhodopirellula sp. SWK7]